MKNYFVNAYIKGKSPNFILNYIRMMEEYVPYLKNGKLEYKQKTIEPEYRLKPHIFINNGKS